MSIFCTQLLRQQLAEPLVFLFELYKSCQLIASREGPGVLGALLCGRLRQAPFQ